MSCCGGNCGCLTGCKGGCCMYPDSVYTENTTTETLVMGVGPVVPTCKMGEAAENGSNCKPNCQCNPCNCNPCNC